MVDHKLNQLALRARLASLEVATTGAVVLGASGTTFTRSDGSFLTDKFARGMEVVAAGFAVSANNGTTLIQQVTALTLTVAKTLTTEAQAAGRTLTVGVPSMVAWENVAFDPVVGTPYLREQYLPGPADQITAGPGGTIESLPQYHIHLHIPQGVGVGAVHGYADAILTHFAPLTHMDVGNGDVLSVRSRPGPYRAGPLTTMPGWVITPIIVSCRLHTTNP